MVRIYRIVIYAHIFYVIGTLSAFCGTFTIPDWVMKSCVFVMKGDQAEGTGFLIGIKEKETTFCYFVTAKHVISPSLMNLPVLHLRLNKKDGSGAEIVDFRLIGFNNKPWLEHSNPAIDLAIAPLAIFDKIDKYDVLMYTVESANDDLFASQAFIQRFKVRPGDSAFTIGLVPYLFIKDSENLVMSRSGTISMVGTIAKGAAALLQAASHESWGKQTGEGVVVYRGVFTMSADSAAVGKPIKTLINGEYLQIEFAQIPENSGVTKGKVIFVLNDLTRLEFDIPEQRATERRIFVRELSTGMKPLASNL